MTLRDLAELAGRNLREAVLRNSLTTLGVAVGVASLVAILSLGVGLQDLASKRLTRSGLFDAVFVFSQRDFRGEGRRSSNASQPRQTHPLDEDARAQIARLPNVKEVYPQIRFITEIRFESKSFPTQVLGIPESFRNGSAFDGMTGSFFSSSTSDEAILQMDFAKELSDQPASLVGKELTLRYAERTLVASGPNAPASRSADDAVPSPEAPSAGISITPRDAKIRIVGITESDPSVGIGGFGGGRVFLPLQTAEQLHVAQGNDFQTLISGTARKPAYSALTVRLRSAKDVAQAEIAIKQMGFATFSILDASKNLTIIFTVFDLLLGLFGGLALTVASLGIINTLVMAILERRREIGVLKALGASDRDVRSLFFVEAGAMGFFGGLIGLGFGWLIGRALTFATNIYLHRQDLPGVKISSVPWWLALGSIAVATIISLAAGLYPASRAAKLDPVEALRYE